MKNTEYVNGIPNFDSPVEKHTRKLKFLFHFPITFSTCDSASVRNWAVRRPATFTLPRKKKRLIAGYIKYVSILCVITLHSCLKTCTNVCKRSVGWRHKEMVTLWRMALPDSDLEIRGEEIFSALRASVWSKKKWGGSPLAPPMDPPLNGTGWVVREAKQANRVYLRCLLLFPIFWKIFHSIYFYFIYISPLLTFLSLCSNTQDQDASWNCKPGRKPDYLQTLILFLLLSDIYHVCRWGHGRGLRGFAVFRDIFKYKLILFWIFNTGIKFRDFLTIAKNAKFKTREVKYQ